MLPLHIVKALGGWQEGEGGVYTHGKALAELGADDAVAAARNAGVAKGGKTCCLSVYV